MGKPAARWRLCVQAEGAQGLKAAVGLKALDTEPDPYVVFVLGGVKKQCAHVDNVPPLQYFTWPDARAEFEIREEAELLQASLVVHVKDKDTLMDRYIGGTSIPLAPLYATRRGDVMCHSKFFTLEFSDEKLKTRKHSGEVKLTINAIDTAKKIEQPSAAPASTVVTEGSEPSGPKAVSGEKKELTTPSTTQQVTQVLAENTSEVQERAKASSQESQKVVAEEQSEVHDAPSPVVAPVEDDSFRPSDYKSMLVSDAITQERVKGRKGSGPPAKAAPSPTSIDSTAQAVALKVELISASNLTRSTSIGNFLDRKPDPKVTFEFYGCKFSSTTLNNVDIKKLVEWKEEILEFPLPPDLPSGKVRKGCGPMDLVVHVMDANILKATYMGGGKIDLSDLFEPRDAMAGPWIPKAVGGNSNLERTIPLIFSDEKLSKRKSCGEVKVCFHYVLEQTESKSEHLSQEGSPAEEVEPQPIATHEARPKLSIESQPTSPEVSSIEPSIVPSHPLTQALSTDIRMLSIELLCGRDMVKPKVHNLLKAATKAVFDRRPDPYATLVLGTQIKRCATANDVDTTFFEWKNAVQVFEFASKPYPQCLEVHIRDEDSAGKDPYMGGARVMMQEIWDEAVARATATPPGDPQLVKTYDLTFIDEKMTKQKTSGSITIRFRWVFSDSELPEHTESEVTVETRSDEQLITQKFVPEVKATVGFVFLRNMSVFNNADVLDSSFDLYIEAHCSRRHSRSTRDMGEQHWSESAVSSVLTDAMKHATTSSDAKVSWGDQLVLALCLPSEVEEEESEGFTIELKDKNAILKDTEIASASTRLKGLLPMFTAGKPSVMTLELTVASAFRKKAKTPLTVKFEAELQFVPHDSPLVSSVPQDNLGGIVTVFLIRSVFKLAPTAKEQDFFALSFSLPTRKPKGLLSFSKSSDDFQTPKVQRTVGFADSKSLIPWWMTFGFQLSPKQVSGIREKESFVIDLAVHMQSGKLHKMIGSLQLDIYSVAFTPTAKSTIEIAQFGEMGSMELEFAAAFRCVTDVISHDTKTAQSVAPQVPSGDLHILVLSARNLVESNPQDEKAEDLDPEVRIAVEPKYIKRKENPVRSMLKTRPLENAGKQPSWNEYLRLEYRLPVPVPPSPSPGVQQGDLSAYLIEDPSKYPPPTILLGVYDIQMPGEKNGSVPIGKAELPLSAFLLPPGHVDDASGECAIPLSVEVRLSGKKTGTLQIEGVFEPLPTEAKPLPDDPRERYRQRCRGVGRALRDKAKKLKMGETDINELLPGGKQPKRAPGRLEVHLIGYRGERGSLASEDRGVTAHIWLGSDLEVRHEVKSKILASSGSDRDSQIEWDAQMTLFTADVCVELLRCELLTLTGLPVGSLKLPLNSLHTQPGGQPSKSWYPITDSSSGAKSHSKKSDSSTHELLLEVAFFPDQALFDPLTVSMPFSSADTTAVVVVKCRRLLYLGSGSDRGLEWACNCSLLGSIATPSQGSSTGGVDRTSFKRVEDTVALKNDEKSVVLRTTWNEIIKLALGSSGEAFVAASHARGALPGLRFELLSKRSGTRFQEVMATTSISLVSLLSANNFKVARWFKFYFLDGENGARLAAIAEFDISTLSINSGSASQLLDEKHLARMLEDMTRVSTIPGVLCVRFLSGRNLVDVDANGEQDPYIIAKLCPRSYTPKTLPSICQTTVSLNGGRHPVWNTGIFELRSEDLIADYIRLEVMDSNEEDHLPDVYIGAIEIALASLFRESIHFADNSRAPSLKQKRTPWLEAWIPIYPAASSVVQTGNDVECAGEVRMEFRFFTEEYYESWNRQRDDASLSRFITVPSTESIRGKLYLHIVQASGLPCVKGMQPAVKLTSAGGFSYVSKPGAMSITDPVWEGESVEIPWISAPTGRSSEAQIQVEIVDLGVRTANVNALALVAFGHIDVSTFLSHHLAKSYHVYPLRGRNAARKGSDYPEILLGCQFIPDGSEQEAESTQLQTPGKRESSYQGNLHIKSTQIHFNLAGYLNHVPLGSSLFLQLRCISGGLTKSELKTITVPQLSLEEIVHVNGTVDFGSESESSVLFKIENSIEKTSSTILPNPIVVGELRSQRPSSGEVSTELLAELEVPIFDYILHDGHLCSAWYALSSVNEATSECTALGDIKLEIQYLPVLPSLTEPAKSIEDNDPGLQVLSVGVKLVTGVDSSMCCTVSMELLGCSAETRPNLPNPALPVGTIAFDETVDLVVATDRLRDSKESKIVRIKLQSAIDPGVIIGSCSWVLPAHLLDESGDPAKSEDVIAALQPEHNAGMDKPTKTKLTTINPELHFRVSRQSYCDRDVNEHPKANVVNRRRGLLYCSLSGESSSEIVKGTLVMSVDPNPKRMIDPSNGILWTQLSWMEKRVLPVTEDMQSPPSLCLVASGSSSNTEPSIATVDSHTIEALIQSPSVETFHRVSCRGPSPVQLDCKLMYMDLVHGKLQLRLKSVSWIANDSDATRPFRVEMRLLSSVTQPWTTSGSASWNRKTSEIVWKESKNIVSLAYNNDDELVEPFVQFMLVQAVQDGGNHDTKKEAFGQISVLSAITSPNAAFQLGTALLTRIGAAGDDASTTLQFEIRFDRSKFTKEEIEAKCAEEEAVKALELAEGTAKLKKAFSSMGGDEVTSIRIGDLQKYVMETSNYDEARTVIQHAAEIETDGDLDRLFELMDVNGDGQISWDEYVSHMQNLHAVAEAAATQKIRQQVLHEASKEERPGEESTEASDAHEKIDDTPAHEPEADDNATDEQDDEVSVVLVQAVQPSNDSDPVRDVYEVPPAPPGQTTREAELPQEASIVEQRRSTRTSEDEIRGIDRKPSASQVHSSGTRSKRLSGQEKPALPIREASLGKLDLASSQQPAKKKSPMLSTYVLDWKVDEVVQWFAEEMELGQYSDAIHKNAVNGKLLLTLSEAELESELGITAVLHKRKLMSQIREFQNRFQYPPPPELPTVKKRAPPVSRKVLPTATTLADGTPAFIKREQLMYQEKQRVRQAESAEPWQPKTTGQTRVFPAKTQLVEATEATQQVAASNNDDNHDMHRETYDDAMSDVFEAVHPDSPGRPREVEPPSSAPAPLPQLPLIQVGSITNTDELFEIVRQRVHQLSALLLPIANERKETWSDFGDDPDDDDDDDGAAAPNEEQTGLRVVFDTLRQTQYRPASSLTDKISRLKFQEGMVHLLAIDVSWHQFDLLFRRLDVDGDSELCWDEFRHVFTRRHISFEPDDLVLLQNALVDFVLARLDSQQWTLSDLFRAFDRDGGGSVSIAEFATLVRFLFTSSSAIERAQGKRVTKRHVYLLMSCLDASADRRISAQEFLRFFFVVWSSKLMEVQDQLLALETSSSSASAACDELIATLRQTKRMLRRALRTNFSRPFRDAMRCLDASVPGPFSGLLSQLQLLPSTLHEPRDSLQVWQVLQGQTSTTRRPSAAVTPSRSVEASRRRVQKGKNEVQRTRLTRQRAPSRQDAELRTPAAHVALDEAAILKFDHRP